MITGKTRYYAILGDPIEQALSPVVHNAAFEALGMDAVMLGCRVTPEELKKAVEGTRALHFEGLAAPVPPGWPPLFSSRTIPSRSARPTSSGRVRMPRCSPVA